MRKLMLLSVVIAVILTACAKRDITGLKNTPEDKAAAKAEETAMSTRNTFSVSSKELARSLEEKKSVNKIYEDDGVYRASSEKNLVRILFPSTSKQVSSVEVIVSTRDFNKSDKDKSITLNILNDLMSSLGINYNEEDLLNVLTEKYNNSPSIKNTDYKYFKYDDEVWLTAVGIYEGVQSGKVPTGVNINISKNKPEND
ncbi:hypothetical protein P6P90_10195 [Ectobacillus antri]|jgi:hypothetical protein|uniref:Lipoprotein n=1 Tax=Ectobacillus antri TaxID=2486280 RepID=A0ABT6H6J2_9BACI|nr:hypothetical protein [Ectobacillus antri]MDG4657309.1 hypothetical protein [Ectobacillus antri]MDG5754339.1 hypothetical protein [Ectobacillus antri]